MVAGQLAVTKGSLHGAVTVDLEDWKCALSPSSESDLRSRPEVDTSYITSSTNDLLRRLDQYEHKATFFVPGEVARAVPDTIRKLSREGHEIASHSPMHVPLKRIPRDSLRDLIARDVSLLRELAGVPPSGFRAPYFSICRSDGWLMSMLAELGFVYDSSVVPTWTPYWGIPFAPKTPYFPDISDISREAPSGKILEIPVSVWPSFKHLPGLPVGGGFYMRMWPSSFLSLAMRMNVHKGLRLVIYVHPGNLEDAKPPISHPTFRDRLSQYAFIERGPVSFGRLLGEFRFGTIRDVFAAEIARTGGR